MPIAHPLKDCMGAVLAESRETVLRDRGLPQSIHSLARIVTADATAIGRYEDVNPAEQRFASDAYLRHVRELADLRGVKEIALWEEALESWRFADAQADVMGGAMSDADDDVA